MPATTGTQLIAAERARQVSVEGWAPEHDDGHASGELLTAARCYLRPRAERLDHAVVKETPGVGVGVVAVPDDWPFEPEAWKPERGSDRVRELVKAGALIAAEIDRLERSAA